MSLYNRINQNQKIEKTNINQVPFQSSSVVTVKEDIRTTKLYGFEQDIKSRVIDELKNMSIEDFDDEKNILKIENKISEIANDEFSRLVDMNITKPEKKHIIENLIDSVTGFGPITTLIEDNSISEIMVNGPSRIYVERDGRIELTDVVFKDEQHLLNIIEKIVGRIGRRIDESSPMVDARLPDGSRVNVIIPPLSLKGPILTIRKFSENPYTVEDLVNFETLTPKAGFFLKCCVESKINIMISGGTGSGKTTTLNVLSAFIPGNERIVTIEDAAELRLWQDHLITLEARPKNSEGRGEVTIRELVKNALRMRPDRIIVGEVRGAEALDMLQAMNTGHEGSLTTGHANSTRDMLSRLETMVLMAGMDLPVRAIREQISAALDLVIHQSRLRDGTRRIVGISEVLGLEVDTVVMQEIFRFVQVGEEDGRIVGHLEPTGIIPKFYDKFAYAGIELPKSVFID